MNDTEIGERLWYAKRISESDARSLCFETGIFIFVGEDYRIQRSTFEANKLFGYVPGELDGKPLEIIIPPEKREKHRHLFAHFFKDPVDREMGKTLNQIIFEGYKKDASLIKVAIWLRVRAVEGIKIAVASIFPVM